MGKRRYERVRGLGVYRVGGNGADERRGRGREGAGQMDGVQGWRSKS